MGSALLVTGATVAAVVVILLIIDRWAGAERTLDHEVAAAILSVIGVVYAILLAFVVVQVWQGDNDAQSNAQAEASEVSQIYFTARAMPEPQRTQLMGLATHYAQTVVNQEWPAMRRGDTSPAAVTDVAKMRTVLLSYHPTDFRGSILMSQTLEADNKLVDFRRQRVATMVSPVPVVMWVGLIGGGVITVAFTLGFGYGRLVPQILMVGSLGALLAFTLWLVYQMSYPFSGPMAIGPDAFQEVLDKFRQFK